LGNCTPGIAIYLLLNDEDGVLLGRPVVPSELRIELIEPSLTALLARAPGEGGGEKTPISGSMLVDEGFKHAIFFGGPANLAGNSPGRGVRGICELGKTAGGVAWESVT
jgi:hypothetical protein